MRRNVFPLEEVPESEWKKLAGKIKAANGKLVVLIHPFFDEEGSQQYKKTIAALLAQTKTPVLVLEESHLASKLKARFQKQRIQVFVIPTATSDQEVFVRSDEKGKLEKPYSKGLLDSGAEKLVNSLIRAGARKIFVGGMQALEDRIGDAIVREYERQWLPVIRSVRKATVTKGCAGTLYRNFIHQRRFEKVRLIPSASWPVKPEYTINKKKLAKARRNRHQ